MEFSYNYLNLLQKVGTTDYCYSADGLKLSVKDNNSNGFTYLGSLILSANSTEFQFGDGIITKTTGGYDVTYHLRDHLGSVRSVVNKNGDVLQQSDYYPFGLKQERSDYVNNSNRFLYNGKELQTTGNLGLLDYGARMYNPELGRMNTLDRFLEKAINLSPYQYAGNDPILNVDVNGDSISVSNLSVVTMLRIVWDLNKISGLNISIKGGMMHAEVSEKSKGYSQTAQNMLMNAISSTKGTVNVADSFDESYALQKSSYLMIGNDHIFMNSSQIDSFIKGTSSDLDPKTMGYGMVFLHELGHTKVGGDRRDRYDKKDQLYIGYTGPNVDFMNKIRSELGGKYGQRESYPYDPKNGLIPFSINSLTLMMNNVKPETYVKIK